MGYYSIPLISTIALTTGQEFRIDVKMTTPGYNYPIPTERVRTGVMACTPSIQTGVSFIKVEDGDRGTMPVPTVGMYL